MWSPPEGVCPESNVQQWQWTGYLGQRQPGRTDTKADKRWRTPEQTEGRQSARRHTALRILRFLRTLKLECERSLFLVVGCRGSSFTSHFRSRAFFDRGSNHRLSTMGVTKTLSASVPRNKTKAAQASPHLSALARSVTHLSHLRGPRPICHTASSSNRFYSSTLAKRRPRKHFRRVKACLGSVLKYKTDPVQILHQAIHGQHLHCESAACLLTLWIWLQNQPEPSETMKGVPNVAPHSMMQGEEMSEATIKRNTKM